MGWQGRMKDGKGKKIFERMHGYVRRNYRLEEVWCHRDNGVAWVRLRREGTDTWVKEEGEIVIPVKRETGEILGNDFFYGDGVQREVFPIVEAMKAEDRAALVASSFLRTY